MTQEKPSIIHPAVVEGYVSVIEGSPVNDEINEITKPVIKRHGNVIKKDTTSFLPGLMPQSLAFFTLNNRYQTRTSEGTLCRKIFTNSSLVENPCGVELLTITPTDPEKKRII
jgi:hypothetical protein